MKGKRICIVEFAGRIQSVGIVTEKSEKEIRKEFKRRGYPEILTLRFSDR